MCCSDKLGEAKRMFIEAARMNPMTGVDPDVQSGLGILFSLDSDYEKASDCFRAALNVTPEVIYRLIVHPSTTVFLMFP